MLEWQQPEQSGKAHRTGIEARAVHMIKPDNLLRVLTTCPRDCYDGCGIVVELHDGVIRRMGDDKAHPIARGKLCDKCTLAYNSTWLNQAARLTRPMLRDGPKGAGRFEAISWEEALGLVGRQIREAAASSGARSVLNAHYTGTCGELAGKYPLRFFRAISATEVDPDTVCNKAGHVALEYTFGRSTEGFDTRTAAQAASIGNVPRTMERLGPPSVVIHPSDARRLNIADGARVRLENEASRVDLCASVSDVTLPGALLAYKGHWPGAASRGSNVNASNPGDKTDMGESSPAHGVEVRISVLD
jgi:anaerobic selenocysteine-containing dehydrogenase